MRAGEYIRSLRSPVFTGAIQISILLYFTYLSPKSRDIIVFVNGDLGQHLQGQLISYFFCWPHCYYLYECLVENSLLIMPEIQRFIVNVDLDLHFQGKMIRRSFVAGRDAIIVNKIV